MKQYILNRTAVSISCDTEQDEVITTDDIFTQEIRDMILTRLDELVSNIPGKPGLVEVTLHVGEVSDVRSPELKHEDA
jgi:hypothetical protein